MNLQENAPFGVFAASQTKGRGQRGKSWLSPRGNLSLSLVLPFPTGVGVNHVPFAVVFLLRQWLQVSYGLRVRLKWPNDLLVDRKKLGGVLCETRGRDELIVGIGLNLFVCPLDQGLKRQATCLDQWVELVETPIEVAQSLLAFWQQNWAGVKDHMPPISELFSDSQASVWTSCVAASGEWKDHSRIENEFLIQKQVCNDGTLVLESLSRVGKSYTLASAAHGLELVSSPTPTCVLLVGPRLIEMAVYLSGENKPACLLRLDPHTLNETDLEPLRSFLPLGVRTWPLYTLCISASSFLPALRSHLIKLGLSVVTVGDRPCLLYAEDAYKVGGGRLAMMEGLLAGLTQEQRWERFPILLVSFDALLTFDKLASCGTYYGGQVVFETSLVWDRQVVNSICTMIDEHLLALEKNSGVKPQLVVTGAQGEKIAAHLGVSYQADLVLEGIRRMVTL